MSELLPVLQADTLREALLEYLGTTFALTEPGAERALRDFLNNPETGIFRGPFVRLRLPFEPADSRWRSNYEWIKRFTPYRHQALAFERLSSLGTTGGWRQPLPTLITTGTGSGKTEAFLYPILDYAKRARVTGEKGMKAIILYPMNALANDQASRLATLLSTDPALAGITAAIYTGQDGPNRTKVSAAGLITDRHVIRDSPPDILLTNYKMLDQLLLRHADAKLWAESATSLRYLVLDEFHTYDGAQGTDVAMLLRRLGLALKANWPVDPAERERAQITESVEKNLLGLVTPIATSATLGDKGDPAAMVSFAETVFGVPFDESTVITETRVTVPEWAGEAQRLVAAKGLVAVPLESAVLRSLKTAVDATPASPDSITRTVLAHLYRVPGPGVEPDEFSRVPDLTGWSDSELLELVKAHPFFTGNGAGPGLIALTDQATSLDELAASAFPPQSVRNWQSRTYDALIAIFVALSHLRATLGRGALTVDVHLWIRELTRINRAATNLARFSWEDDGALLPSNIDEIPYFPAIYCRHCGRSGWGITLAPTGMDLDTDDDEIRTRHLHGSDRFRALIYAPQENNEPDAKSEEVGVRWLLPSERRITGHRPEEGESYLPVLTWPLDNAGAEPSERDTCPSCLQTDGIRFLGSAIATLLSVALSTQFGTPGLDSREKKALVFTDSVQDAAHRAGFVQARSHALTMRSIIRGAVGEEAIDLDLLVDRILDSASDAASRFRLLPPDLADRDKFAAYWKQDKPHYTVSRRIRKRLLLDVMLEFGLRSEVGRTLEATGTVVSGTRVTPQHLLGAAQGAWKGLNQERLAVELQPTDSQLIAWVRGVLEHMRLRGAIDHEWFNRFREEDGNRWWITGGRRAMDGMPGFGAGHSAPGFPVLGGKSFGASRAPGIRGSKAENDLEPIASTRGWYAAWTRKALGLNDSTEAATLARLLFSRLAEMDLVSARATSSGGRTFALRPTDVVVEPADDSQLENGELSLACNKCGHVYAGTKETVAQLSDGPCLTMRCPGHLERNSREPSYFYREMYSNSDPARVIAREHSSLLEDEVRLAYETEFKAENPRPNAPNVLVATPTLEMGIDIGDLSTVMLASLPFSVAAYLQRVGRAGRLTGNSLALTFLTARGGNLPQFQNPATMINGAVKTPATYLGAEEILRRQYFAYLADNLVRNPEAPKPRRAKDAIGSFEPGSYLGELIALAHSEPELLDSFIGVFPTLPPEVTDRLRQWALPDEWGVSGLSERVARASSEWNARMELLTIREKEIQTAINGADGLRAKAESPAKTDDDERNYRTAKAALRLTGHQLGQANSEFWVAVLEEYGLLPNYTLLDDAVTLEVAISWTDPDSGQFMDETMEISRGSAQALRDFAPGSTFYARGYAIEIDALDLGPGDDAVHTWLICPTCDFNLDATLADATGEPLPANCPLCGNRHIADVAQRLDVVELNRVSAVIRREDSTIDDRTDERRIEHYTIRPLVTANPNQVGYRQWFIRNFGFGIRYLRNLEIRWLNLGHSKSGGETLRIAGEQIDVSLFRICEECGKLSKTPGQNVASDHRPWCRLRKSPKEQARGVALARSLTTDGLVIRLPESITLGDDFAVPSLRAALMLALQLHIGGRPDHLAIAEVVDPNPGESSSAHALLIHDTVPGGTGYLAELADPEALWAMLHRAWVHLAECECGPGGDSLIGRIACENCLLPFARTREVPRTSRAVAVKLLGEILTGSTSDGLPVPESCSWEVEETEPEIFDPESSLEQLFRKDFIERVRLLGASVTEVPRAVGNVVHITMPGGRRWTLEPQRLVSEAGVKPDFILTSSDAGVPRTAIFTDGLAYHYALGKMNRVADDAAKRAALRALGYQVISVTWADLDPEQRRGVAPPWFNTDHVGLVMAELKDQLSPALVRLISAPTMELLLSWIQDPNLSARERLARYIPLFAVSSTRPIPAAATLPQAVANALCDLGSSDGTALVESHQQGWIGGAMGLGVKMAGLDDIEVAVVLDDRPETVGSANRLAWEQWLRLGNLLNFRAEVPTWIGTVSDLPAVVRPQAEPESAVNRAFEEILASLSDQWQTAFETATAEEKRFLVDLVQVAPNFLPPTLGVEVGDGIPLSIAWPDQMVAVRYDGLDEFDELALIANGWRLIDQDVSSVISEVGVR